MTSTRWTFAASFLAAICGATFETPDTGGLATMALTTVAAAISTAAAHRRVSPSVAHELPSSMADMASAAVGGSIGAIVALAAAALLGRGIDAMGAMIWMAGGMGAMFGVSLVHWLEGRRSSA